MAIDLFQANEIVSRANVNQRITQMNAYFPVSVANGGTGQTSLSSGQILLGNGTSGITSTATLPVSKGGTGGITETEARTNLEVMTTVQLYSNSSGTQSTIALSDSANNYTYIEIYYFDVDRGNATYGAKVSGPNGRTVGLSAASHISGTTYNGYYTYTAHVNISGTSITWLNNRHGFFYRENGVCGEQTVNRIYIYRVVGFKY